MEEEGLHSYSDSGTDRKVNGWRVKGQFGALQMSKFEIGDELWWFECHYPSNPMDFSLLKLRSVISDMDGECEQLFLSKREALNALSSRLKELLDDKSNEH